MRKRENLLDGFDRLVPLGQRHFGFRDVVLANDGAHRDRLPVPGGAVHEVVRDGVNGWICADVADMAAHIASLDVPPIACREFVARHFSVARMTDRYLDVYERALTGAAAESAAELEA